MKLLSGNVKNLVVFGLLFCVITLSLPKDFFHEHDNHKVHNENDWDYSFSADEAHCFVCEIDLFNYSFITNGSIKFDPKALVHGKEQVYFLEKANHFDLQDPRGPPAIV